MRALLRGLAGAAGAHSQRRTLTERLIEEPLLVSSSSSDDGDGSSGSSGSSSARFFSPMEGNSARGSLDEHEGHLLRGHYAGPLDWNPGAAGDVREMEAGAEAGAVPIPGRGRADGGDAAASSDVAMFSVVSYDEMERQWERDTEAQAAAARRLPAWSDEEGDAEDGRWENASSDTSELYHNIFEALQR